MFRQLSSVLAQNKQAMSPAPAVVDRLNRRSAVLMDPVGRPVAQRMQAMLRALICVGAV
jgi:hypothetical protein